jgi:hypothetical protein
MGTMVPVVMVTVTAVEVIMLLMHTKGILRHLPKCDMTINTLTRGTETVIMMSIVIGITMMTDTIVITIIEITEIRIVIAETTIIIQDIIVRDETGVETASVPLHTVKDEKANPCIQNITS